MVGEGDTALALGSGDVRVLGTPALLRLAEAACVNALENRLNPGETSVGVEVRLEHLAPSVPGQKMEAVADLNRVEGRKLFFSFVVRDDAGEVARGEHLRVVVERESFLERAARRSRGD